MRIRPLLPYVPKFSLAMALLSILLIALAVGGGASRADVFGQVIVRGTAWLLLVVAMLFDKRPGIQVGYPAVFFITAAALLPLLQLIPLPPSLWITLPGRSLIVRAAALVGEPQPWRPWSIVPSETMNAAHSLIVPIATMWLTLSLTENERERLPGLMLCLAIASTLIGLIQTSSLSFDNPLINESPLTISGTFANRNHFALQMAIGCALVPAWVLNCRHVHYWRAVVGFALVPLFMLASLVSGSRAGLLLSSVGMVTSLLLSQARIKNVVGRYQRWVFPTMVTGIVVIIGFLVLASVAANRAESINRLFANDPARDLRARALPTVWSMLVEYFPFGAGMGSFDSIFRIHEPFHLLKPTYFNHAHNDLIEVVTDAGLPGLLLLLAALCWWGWASIWAWGAGSGPKTALPKLGSTILLLVLIASAVDYPARTPIIMAWSAIAAVWLSGHSGRGARKALPNAG